MGPESREKYSLFSEKHRKPYQASYNSADPSVGNPRHDAFFNAVTNRGQSLAEPHRDVIANLQREVNYWKSRAEANEQGKGYGPHFEMLAKGKGNKGPY